MATTTQASILLLGAKSTERPLEAIPHELSELENLFSQHQANARAATEFEIKYHPYFTQNQLKDKLSQLQNQIAILHFAGHSDAEGILTDDNVVYSRHLAGHIASWVIRPSMVVLNGCHNAQQVKWFHDAGVSVVIATHRAIDDNLAAGFAQAFYASLLQHPKTTTLQQAFEQASSNALMGENRDSVLYNRSLDIEDDESLEWDWSIFPQNEVQLGWTFDYLITTARPVLDAKGKRYNPYKGLAAFLEDDQPWFFGREQVVGELLTSLLPENGFSEKPRFFSVLGASGSGKSSLINAGLIPQLRAQSPASLILHTHPGGDALRHLVSPIAAVLFPGKADFADRLEQEDKLTQQLMGANDRFPNLIKGLLYTLQIDSDTPTYEHVFFNVN